MGGKVSDYCLLAATHFGISLCAGFVYVAKNIVKLCKFYQNLKYPSANKNRVQ